ncbi:myosin-H heavy chain-like protein [Trifolium pratense]|uniref:Myosin-H heavy chain-like protein n=1 Tax=Trifolium pratense TaxID=57577 RepID=A0A2K3KH45_TRIPR|nr:myosin-H heavy chain-like protein [Trifolium pratense]
MLEWRLGVNLTATYILPMDLHSGHHLVEDQNATETQTDTPVKKFGTESDSKLRRSYIEHQHAYA